MKVHKARVFAQEATAIGFCLSFEKEYQNSLTLWFLKWELIIQWGKGDSFDIY